MKINKNQIGDLYAFTRQHFVVYYDLQTELVDHLANDIESMWQEQSTLSFAEAKQKAFKKFGVFGFMEPIEQKQKAMNKRYMLYLWYELKAWFSLPKLIVTVTLFLFFYIVFSTKHAEYFSITFYYLIAIWCIYKSILLNRLYRRRKEKSNKKWLMEDMIFKQAGGTLFIFLSQIHALFTISEKAAYNIYFLIVLTTIFTLLVLVSYISFELLPNKAEKLLAETYPEFSL